MQYTGVRIRFDPLGAEEIGASPPQPIQAVHKLLLLPQVVASKACSKWPSSSY